MFLSSENLLKFFYVAAIFLTNTFYFKSFSQNTEMEHLRGLNVIELAGVCKIDPEILPLFPSIFPFKNKNWVSSVYGVRMHPINKVIKLHNGVDFACSKGSAIIATANGRVLKVEYGNPITGNSVTVSHLEGYKTFYGHLERIEVLPNALVVSGDVIGISGKSGKVTGPHLHYSIVKDGRSLDPLPYCFIARYALEDKEN
ncbi:hypothetical protein LCGC14_1729910 [marine sediment metagenome]|uniref:M23ase beta-sheet core domain-containing protein n=1 Tax=marine sediment metagenome TaxID=412755 RepID=A0A0F9H9N2_9ZZZZ